MHLKVSHSESVMFKPQFSTMSNFYICSMRELHERLRANELRQKHIDRQLQSLEIDSQVNS